MPIELQIAHVLFVDMVGYSKMLIEEQHECLDILNQATRNAVAFRAAEAADKLIRLPSGDGMALAFFTTPDAPVLCAIQISQALKDHPEVQVRMGVHSGPVSATIDVNDKANVAGAGINMAQRVMDCGDAGHILLSRHVAEDLAEYRQWQPHIHELGGIEVKHGVVISVFNFYSEEFGNPEVPRRFGQIGRRSVGRRHLAGRAWRKAALYAGSLLLLALATFWILSHRAVSRSTGSAAITEIREKSVAVLPFDNLSDDKQNAYFADGVQDEILTNLAKIADLKVISRTSVMQYKQGVAPRNLREIGRALGVAHLLEGSVQRAANRVRVIAQLIDARTDAHLWAQTFDRDLADVFAIQSEIAKAIAEQLHVRLSPREKAAMELHPTSDLAAFDLYTRAKTLRLNTTFSARAQNDLLQCVDLLNQAVTRDPAFLLAWCELAAAHNLLYFTGGDHTPARLALADTAVQTALRLRPDAGEAHLALAKHLYRGYLDYDRARAELAIARGTLPNDPQIFEFAGNIDRRQGRWDEAARNFEQAIELDPRNFSTLHQISYTYRWLRWDAKRAAVLDRALAIVPRDVNTRVARAMVDLDWHADPRPLHATIEAILAEDSAAASTFADTWLTLALCERDPAAAARALVALADTTFGLGGIRLTRTFGEGLIARVRGDEAAAAAAFAMARVHQEEVTRAQPDYAPALCVLGLIDAGLGRKDEALRAGRRAVELLPVARDSINGALMVEYYAIICAWTGETDLALQQLAMATQIPGGVSYGQLKLHPFWDPLRGDPRFDKIVASLAPRESK